MYDVMTGTHRPREHKRHNNTAIDGANDINDAVATTASGLQE